MSDDGRLRLSNEVTKLYPPSSTTSAAPIPEPPIGWQVRKNCPNRPIREFQILGEDGETIVLEMKNQQQGGTATAEVVQQTQPPPQPKPHHGTVPVATVPPVVSQNPPSLQQGTDASAQAISSPPANTTGASTPAVSQPATNTTDAASAPAIFSQPTNTDASAPAISSQSVNTTGTSTPAVSQPTNYKDASAPVISSQPVNTTDASTPADSQRAGSPSTITDPNDVPAPVIERQQSITHTSQSNHESLQWDPSGSTIQTIIRSEGFNEGAEDELVNNDPFDYMELYQGCHPYRRNEPHQPHSIYPIAKLYESLSNDSPHTRFRLLWDISLHERLVEDMSQSVFQSLRHAKPKLLWIKDVDPPSALKNKSLFPSVFGSSSSAAASGSSYTPRAIDLTESSSNDKGVDDIGSSSSLLKGDDGHSGNYVEDVVVTDELPPIDRVKSEKNWFNDLKSLYTDPFKKPYVKIDIGGRGVMLNSFHYEEAENDITFGKKNKKFEYIDIVDNALLYRWELKGCIANTTKIGRKMVERVYFALCRYQPLDSSSTRMYDCLAIQITRCKDRAPLFLMKEVGEGNASKIECWAGWNSIKYFYVVPEVPIPVQTLLEERQQYWKCNNYLYRPDQNFLLDTKSPGVRTQLDATVEQIQRAEKYWSVKAGPKPATDGAPGHHIKLRAVVISSPSEGTVTTKTQTTSEREKLKAATDLKKAEDRIKALTKQVELLQQQKKDDKKKTTQTGKD